MADKRLAYETSDISARFAALLAGSFVLAVVAPLLVVSFLYGVLWRDTRPAELRPGAFKPGITHALELQVSPARDFALFHEKAVRRLESAGWVDEKKGVAHIPIGEAMRLRLERQGAEEGK